MAGGVWAQTARLAGWGERTRVHGVGDGANWIRSQFHEHFGPQGAYLIDFYHVSEYLGAAAPEVAQPGQEKHWRRRQQGRLLDNRCPAVLRSLEKHLLADPKTASAAHTAHRYLADRRAHLDYAGARRQQLPIGSGEIESAHRHVIQHRLKIAGGWWTERNMEAMLQLRAARANNWWATLYVSICLSCLVSISKEDRAVTAPAGAVTAASARSCNLWIFESAAQLDPSTLLCPELEPLPERRLYASSYPQG